MKLLALFASIALLCSMTSAYAQSELLPKRVGALIYGYRSYFPQTARYGASGQKEGLGDLFNSNFSGNNLLTGKAGGDLRRLAEELQNFDPHDADDKDSILSRLNLGTLRGNVNAKVSAQVFGLAYGLSKNITGFAAIPLIKARVDTKLYFEGTNNAPQLKEELGDLAFEELKDGLDKAASVSTEDIEAAFAEAGYRPIGTWSKSGVGDLRFGARGAKSFRVGGDTSHNLGSSVTAYIPTGYTEKPDLLTDVNFGKGYYALGLGLSEQIVCHKYYRLLFGGEYTLNSDSKTKKRVPRDHEALVDEDRTTEVHLNPGDDTDIYTGAGFVYAGVGTAFRLGQTRHLADRYGGRMDGNYEQLSRNSDAIVYYYELSTSFNTIDAYQQGHFFYPFTTELLYHSPYEAKNAPDNKYFQLTLTGFFKT